MTFSDFRLSAKEFFIEYGSVLRYGQALMIRLNGTSPYLYKSIPDYANPFYDDNRADEFFNYLSLNWSKAF
jgi:hypothetical protein